MFANLTFAKKCKVKPKYIMQPKGVAAVRVGEFHTQVVEIRNARAQKHAMTLDENGFQLMRHRLEFPSDLIDEQVSERLVLAVENYLINKLGALQVRLFDHTVRSSSPDSASRGTANHVHNDFTEKSFHERLSALDLDISGKRAVQLNLWIPLTEPVVTAPLTILDGTSLLMHDLIACDLEYPDRMGEIYELAYNPLQLWYYYPAMLKNEALLFKGYDTMTDGRVRYAPHSAFKHPEEKPHSPIRRSIEFRAIATFMDRGLS